MNKQRAEEVLADLKQQLKEAQERVIVLLGATQGCEATLAALDEPIEEPLVIEAPKRKRTRKT